MWMRSLCLICIYILRNYAFQILNEASFLAFLQPAANRLKFFIPPSRRLGKTSSVDTFINNVIMSELYKITLLRSELLEHKKYTHCLQ